jgi:serine/threonine protein kinase
MGNLCQPHHPKEGPGAYRIMRQLGEGGYGTVHLARRFSDGKSFAIKKSRESREKMWGAELR